jgi:hypothetical protein
LRARDDRLRRGNGRNPDRRQKRRGADVQGPLLAMQRLLRTSGSQSGQGRSGTARQPERCAQADSDSQPVREVHPGFVRRSCFAGAILDNSGKGSGLERAGKWRASIRKSVPVAPTLTVMRIVRHPARGFLGRTIKKGRLVPSEAERGERLTQPAEIGQAGKAGRPHFASLAASRRGQETGDRLASLAPVPCSLSPPSPATEAPRSASGLRDRSWNLTERPR